ncbi:glycosyltransferase [Agilicoccus flavus]|uniref:glycosyltransferase n=1 Tax=Agilicoccus flavus TaxID=2775968 RepID=UPI001CF710D5|nr:glycosyltransferase [Agilicoccus flavus]
MRLLAPTPPLFGHVLPTVTLGAGLARRGHDVTVLTGARYAQVVRDCGLTFRPLPAEIDYDDRDLGAFLAARHDRARRPARTRLAAARRDIIGLFVETLGEQHAALDAELADEPVDAVLADGSFLGVLPLARRPRAQRVPVMAVSATPLSVRSVDCAHFGSGLQPGDSAFTRMRNRQIDWLLRHGPLRPVQEAMDAALAPFGVAPGTANYFDQLLATDRAFHLAPAGLEYPRRDRPDLVRFVGPLRYDEPTVELPDWWPEVTSARRVVHVTQGTLDTRDPTKLLVPAVRGLAGADALVVVSTGRRPVGDLLAHLPGGLPANVRVAEFVPYDALLPHTDVVVTNGGFGGVQRALAHGVPLVVAGEGEDKPEVAARVAWAGVGLDLRTGRPSPRRIARGVGRVVGSDRFARGAARLRDEITALGDPVEAVDAELRAACADRGATRR